MQKPRLHFLQPGISGISPFGLKSNGDTSKGEGKKKGAERAFIEQRRRAKSYYQRAFEESPDRVLIFDLGYCGSVGAALSTALARPADKVYFWQTDANRKRDRRLKTKTTSFSPRYDVELDPYRLLLEELLAPLSGGVVGWSGDATPLEEPLNVDENFSRDTKEISDSCIEYAQEFCKLFENNAKYAQINDCDSLIKSFRILFEEAPYPNLDIFKNICFPDPVTLTVNHSTHKKVDAAISWRNPLSGTGFEQAKNTILPQPRIRKNHKVGVHIHLYNISQANEFLRYLQQFPVSFDLFVTLTDAKYAPTFMKLFGKCFLPNMQRREILVVPNRGLDVAPWLVALRERQQEYDFFCHAHSKASIIIGDVWRKYLLDDLLDPEAVLTTLNVFEDDPTLGMLFPEPFPPVKQIFISYHIPIYGSEK